MRHGASATNECVKCPRPTGTWTGLDKVAGNYDIHTARCSPAPLLSNEASPATVHSQLRHATTSRLQSWLCSPHPCTAARTPSHDFLVCLFLVLHNDKAADVFFQDQKHVALRNHGGEAARGNPCLDSGCPTTTHVQAKWRTMEELCISASRSPVGTHFTPNTSANSHLPSPSVSWSQHAVKSRKRSQQAPDTAVPASCRTESSDVTWPLLASISRGLC